MIWTRFFETSVQFLYNVHWKFIKTFISRKWEKHWGEPLESPDLRVIQGWFHCDGRGRCYQCIPQSIPILSHLNFYVDHISISDCKCKLQWWMLFGFRMLFKCSGSEFQVHIIGEIASASGFPHSSLFCKYNCLFCKYSCKLLTEE